MQRYTWDCKNVSQRFEECVTVLNNLPGHSIGHKTFWPDIKYTPQEIAKQEKTPLRLRPLPDAIDRAEETLGWITWVKEPDNRKIIWLRASRYSWREIGKRIGIPFSTARYRYESQLALIVSNLLLDTAKDG